MRVEKAWELARFLLKDNTVTIDTIEEKGFIRNQAHLPIPIKEHIPVIYIIQYRLVWFNWSRAIQQWYIYRKINFDQISIK